ncbi:hypothetical protein F5Y16DRAFT_380189 [Xylariaceae sp. FL0255]|nr:hypothetical protein F5Y16DRAFT_380189 [Xylariaceae sp. FL0255]
MLKSYLISTYTVKQHTQRIFGDAFYGSNKCGHCRRRLCRSEEPPEHRRASRSAWVCILEPTWRINPIKNPLSPSSSQATSKTITSTQSSSKDSNHDRQHYCTCPHSRSHKPGGRKPPFKDFVKNLTTVELREVIMNACLRDFDTHRDVVTALKRLQQEKPRAICCGSPTGHVRRPVVGLYLYCRSQRELVDIVLDLERSDTSGDFRRDVRDLVVVMRNRVSGD